MLIREIHGDKTEVFTLPRLLRPLLFLTCVVISTATVLAQTSSVIEPCPATPQKPAIASGAIPTKVGSKVNETVIDSNIAEDPAVREMLAPYKEKVSELSMV